MFLIATLDMKWYYMVNLTYHVQCFVTIFFFYFLFFVKYITMWWIYDAILLSIQLAIWCFMTFHSDLICNKMSEDNRYAIFFLSEGSMSEEEEVLFPFPRLCWLDHFEGRTLICVYMWKCVDCFDAHPIVQSCFLCFGFHVSHTCYVILLSRQNM